MEPVYQHSHDSGHGRKPKKDARRRVPNVLIALGIALLLVAGGVWGYQQWQYWDASHRAGEIQQLAKVSEPVTSSSHSAPSVDWDALKAVNPDIVGWLQIPDTKINYPVYQGKDNDEYLRSDVYHNYLISGELFIDYQNTAPGMADRQTIIYGHHMKDGTMFESVAAMDDQTTFDKVKTIWYVTEGKAYELEPLFLYYTTPDDTKVRQFGFDSDKDWHAYLEERYSHAVTACKDAKQVIAGAEHVLTLSTCNYYDGYGRTELVCVPKDEAAAARAGTTKHASDTGATATDAADSPDLS